MNNRGKIKVQSTAKKHQDPYKADVIYGPLGQLANPWKTTKIPGNSMSTEGYGNIPLWTVPNVGEPRMIYPDTGTHYFPGADNFTEYPVKKSGGQIYDRLGKKHSIKSYVPFAQNGMEQRLAPVGGYQYQYNTQQPSTQESPKVAKTLPKKGVVEREIEKDKRDAYNKLPISVRGEAPLEESYPELAFMPAARGLGWAGNMVADAITGSMRISKLNPWAFKPNPIAYYRGVGKEGLEDALNSGLIRSRDQEFMHPYFAKPGEFKTAQYYNPEGIIEAKNIKFINKDAGAIPANPDFGTAKPGWHSQYLESLNTNDPNIRLLQKHWLQGYKEVPKDLPGSPNNITKVLDNEGSYIGRRTTPMNKEEEVFNSFLSPEAQSQKFSERTVHYDRNGNIIPNPDIKKIGGTNKNNMKKKAKMFPQIQSMTEFFSPMYANVPAPYQDGSFQFGGGSHPFSTQPTMAEISDYGMPTGPKWYAQLGGSGIPSIDGELPMYNYGSDYMNKGGVPCYNCGGSKKKKGGQADINQGPEYFTNKQNNFHEWLRNTALSATEQEMMNQFKQNGGTGYTEEFPLANPYSYGAEYGLPEAKKGGFMGIQKSHKGWCTPLSNPHCTGARRRLALTLKKHHGFHKKQEGGVGPTGESINQSDDTTQAVIQALQQGSQPDDLIQELTQQGSSPEEAQSIVQQAAQMVQEGDEQEQQDQPEESPDFMRYGGIKKYLPKAQTGTQTPADPDYDKWAKYQERYSKEHSSQPQNQDHTQGQTYYNQPQYNQPSYGGGYGNSYIPANGYRSLKLKNVKTIINNPGGPTVGLPTQQQQYLDPSKVATPPVGGGQESSNTPWHFSSKPRLFGRRYDWEYGTPPSNSSSPLPGSTHNQPSDRIGNDKSYDASGLDKFGHFNLKEHTKEDDNVKAYYNHYNRFPWDIAPPDNEGALDKVINNIRFKRARQAVPPGLQYGGPFYMQNGAQFVDLTPAPGSMDYSLPQIPQNVQQGRDQESDNAGIYNVNMDPKQMPQSSVYSKGTAKDKWNMNGEDMANWGIAGMQGLTGILDANDNRKKQKQQDKRLKPENWMATNYNRDRGNGLFRPDQQNVGNMITGKFGGSYNVGDEVDMTDEELQQFLKNGGTVTYI